MRSGASSGGSPSPGRVVSAGTATRGGREGVELALNGPARLVLAESYNRGRRASCDGRELGVPEVGGVYGTAWRVPKTCKDVEITFAPNRLVNAGYALSLAVGLLLLALVLFRRPGPSPEPLDPREEAPARALSARHAALLAVPIALVFGFAFAARGTPLFALGVFFVLWRGVGARELALAGGAVLAIAVPILTVLIRPDNRGGYNPEYPIDRVAVHWVAVAGVSLLILALSRAMARPGRARSAPPSAAAPPAPAP
jgi:cytochrome b561